MSRTVARSDAPNKKKKEKKKRNNDLSVLEPFAHGNVYRHDRTSKNGEIETKPGRHAVQPEK